MRIVVIGTGKMSEAILAGIAPKYEVEIVGRDAQKVRQLKEKYQLQYSALLDSPVDIEGKIIVLCVKPHALESISIFLSGEAQLAISVLAGVKLEELKNRIKAHTYVRAMPNLAAMYGKSMTTLCGDGDAKELSLEIAGSFGATLWVGSEKEIDIATAVAGSGPAFLALVAEAMADGAVHEGLKRNDAQRLVEGLFAGMSKLLENEHPALLKDGVMSPGGTTAAGYSALEEGSVRSAFMKAIQKAYERAKR